MSLRVSRGRLLILAALLVAAVPSAVFLRAAYCLSRAQSALAERDAESAMGYLQGALQTGLRQAETHYLLARAHRRRGEFVEAQRELGRAKELGYSTVKLQREEWLMLAQAGQVRSVQKHLDEMLRDPQGDAPAICEAFVEGYFATHQFDRGFTILDAWQKDFPNDPQPDAFRALHLDHSGDWPLAAEHFQKALKLAPGRVDLRIRLAGVLVELHRYEEAIEQYKRGLELAPTDAALLTGWGKCAQSLGRQAEAREGFEQALRHHPDDLDAKLAMGQFELAEGRAEEAVRLLQSVYDQRPRSSQVRYSLGQALQATGKADAAREHFEFVGQAKAALLEVNRLTEQVRKQPSDCQARYRIGTLLLKFDDPAQGAGWLQSVLEFQPRHAETHRALADYYAGIGKPELAEQHGKLAGDAKSAKPVRLDAPFHVPGIRQPQMIGASGAGLADDAEVLGVVVEGDARAYSLESLSHTDGHVVNDLIGGTPVTVTYCDKSNCTRAFTASGRAEPLDMGTGGFQKGEMSVSLNGEFFPQKSKDIPLKDHPVERTTWKAWREAHPETVVYIRSP